jgi:hypothetical protein
MAKTNKKVYVLRGSTDGIFGVYTSMPKCYDEILNFYEDHNWLFNDKKLTLQDLKKSIVLSSNGNANLIDSNSNTYFTIEPFTLNL